MTQSATLIHRLTYSLPEAWRSTTNRQSHLGPGKVIARLGKESRDILSQLKSDDISSIRPDLLYIDDPWTRIDRENRDLKLEFDRKVLLS